MILDLTPDFMTPDFTDFMNSAACAAFRAEPEE